MKSEPGAANTADRILDLNLAMRAHYAEALARTAAELSPVLIAEFNGSGGRYTLLCDGRERVAEPVSPVYARLKAVSHTSLALYVLLERVFDGQQADGWQEALAAFRGRMREALAHLGDAEMTPEAVNRCDLILRAGVALASRALDQGRIGRADYEAYAQHIAAAVQQNTFDAAALQVQAYRRVLRGWRAELGEQRWADLHAIVATSWNMREGNVHHQILETEMAEGAPGERLFLAEGVTGRDELLSLLARILMDRRASALVFRDPYRLDTELMGPGTRHALEAGDGEAR